MPAVSITTSRLPALPAARLRRPSWRDPRLLVGLLLVLVSVALGARLVAAADDTTPVWAARSTLAVGTPLTGDTLTAVRVRLPSVEGYLPADAPPPEGLVATRAVGAGELVPASAAGAATDLARRPVVVPVSGPLPEGLRAGALVDVWVSRADPAARDGSRRPAERLVERADVRAVTDDGGGLSATSTTGVEVLLDPAQLPVVLDALAAQASVALVPVPGSAPAQADR